MNTRWLLVGGLRALGADDEADTLAQGALDAVERSGFREYYHPRTGAGHGEQPLRLRRRSPSTCPAGFGAAGAGVARAT